MTDDRPDLRFALMELVEALTRHVAMSMMTYMNTLFIQTCLWSYYFNYTFLKLFISIMFSLLAVRTYLGVLSMMRYRH